jgi:hypothetical protein
MLPPRRHFSFQYLLIINRLSILLPKSRALILIILIPFFLSIIPLNAQVLTINNPNIKAAITDEQVTALGISGKINDNHPVKLNFEGIGNLDEVQQFYNGGTSNSRHASENCGITFSPGATAIVDMQNGGTGNFTKDLLPNTVLFSPSFGMITINDEKGFSSGFNFSYTSSEVLTITIFDSLDGKGSILLTRTLQPVIKAGSQKTGAYYDSWLIFRESFDGVARSVVISGTPDKYALDEMTFGKTERNSEIGRILATHQSTTEKGKFFLAGASRFGISVGNSKSQSGGSTTEGSEETYYDLDFLPKAGYYFIDNLVGGLFIDLELYNNKAKTSGYGYKGATFIIGPFARYYVPVNDKFIPFAEAQVGFGIDHYRSRSSSSDDWYKTNENIFTYRIGAGATYFINDVVGFDMFMGYLHDSYKYEDSSVRSTTSETKSIYNEFNLQLGIVVVL